MSSHNNFFAKRTNWPLKNNIITQTFHQLKQDGAPILDLTLSNPTQAGLNYPWKDIQKGLIHEKNCVYEPQSQGLPESRQAISDYYTQRGWPVLSEQIFLTASTSEAYGFLFKLLANPGDTVLFPQPSYPLFSFLGDLHDVRLDFYQLTYDQTWSIDLDDLERKCCSAVKAICLVNPNNPTGSYVSSDEINRLIRIAEKYQMTIICDEVFWEFSLDQQKHASFLTCHTVPVCVLGGLSKTLGLPHMKLAWLILNGPEAWQIEAHKRLEIIADTFLSVNTPVQNALAGWLRMSADIQENIQLRIKDNLNILKTEITSDSVTELLQVEGGWYAVLKLPRIRTEEEWVLKLLTKYHVFVHPGFFYDFTDEPYLVLSLLPEENLFKEGVQRLISRVQQQCG